MDKTGIPSERRKIAVVTREEFTTLSSTVDDIKRDIKTNTELTEDVVALLRSFKIMMHIGKWVTILCGTFVAVTAAIKSGTGIFKP